MDQKRSAVWLHFGVVSPGCAKCNLCGSTYSFKGGSTTNLRKHLNSRHPTVSVSPAKSKAAKFSSSSTKGAPASTSTVEPEDGEEDDVQDVLTVSDVTSASATFTSATSINSNRKSHFRQSSILEHIVQPISLSRQQKINSLILNLIVKDLQPFSILEDTGFRELIHGLEPSYNIPSRSTFSTSFLLQKYNQQKEKLKVLLSKASSISVTTDAWTSSHSQTSYIGYTAHFIGEDWKLYACLLECGQYNESHTAQHLRDDLVRVANEWDISNKIISVTTDNASNIKAAIKLTEWYHIGCFAHSVNLIVQSGLDHPDVAPLRKKVKEIVDHFHRSTKTNLKFMAMQKQLNKNAPTLKLKNDIVTRWNSTFHMFERFLNTQEPLTATVGILHSPIEFLSEEDWVLLKEICTILKPFEQITTEMSAEKNVTLSKVIVIVKGIKSAMQKIKATMTTPNAKALIKHYEGAILARFSTVETNYLMARCAILDPRFKSKIFSSNLNFEVSKERLEKDVTRLIDLERQQNNIESGTTNSSIENMVDDSQHEEDLIWSDFDTIAQSPKEINSKAGAITEVRSYLTESVINRKENPLEWWKTRVAMYPHLAKLAKQYLCILATSVPSERIFSKAGQLISERRSRLKGDHVKQILFLNCTQEL